MLDFLMISVRSPKKDTIEIYPEFKLIKTSDLMIRGSDFYAVWVEERGLWSTDEQDALDLIDREIDKFVEENKDKYGDSKIKVLHMWNSSSGMIDKWHRYCQKQMRDCYHNLDERIIFSNIETKKKDYASKKLPYPLENGDCPSYDKLISTLYLPEERAKIEWAVGAIISGDSKHIQKFLVLYGAAGTGKSTILNVIQKLFEGYYSVFDAKALGSSNNSFALESFKSNPLVAIQHDGDLSRIEDNTRLNSLVAHETMTVNEKFKSTYSNRFISFLFMGTNKPVRITDAKSGIIRRLIDVAPSGKKIPLKEYKDLMNRINFELGAIASHCLEVYKSNKDKYDGYIPITMLGASNDFYNYILDMYFSFKKMDGVTLKSAWEKYKVYCDEAKVSYPMSQRVFKEELKNYFWEFTERITLDDGTRARNYYHGFRTDRFKPDVEKEFESYTIIFEETQSLFDKECKDYPAQYAGKNEAPSKTWSKVTTKLSDLDTSKLHCVRVPENHIVIDFDLRDDNGEKSLEKNIKEASKWPKTYAELSKSGQGIHLHYIYTGDLSKVSRIYSEHIEIKIFTGKSSLRRKLTKCNTLPIAILSSGLPTKKGDRMIQAETIKNEKHLRTLIKKALNKEYHNDTSENVNFIQHILDEAYKGGLHYDVSDLHNAVYSFAARSTNQADANIKKVIQMKFKSDDPSKDNGFDDDGEIIFFDFEVFKNVCFLNWKLAGEDRPVNRMINPTAAQLEEMMKFKLVGFNNRKYDNHIFYAIILGYNNEQLFNLSQRIIKKKTGFFGEAYNLSYTDVYDFSTKKQSLKKFEVELGIHHKELALSWDEPVPEDKWIEVSEYCDNDVIATEAVFNSRKADFDARKILADLAGMTVNDTTNSLTARIIFGNNRHPQDEFNYRNMGEGAKENGNYTVFDSEGRPIFPGYKHENGVSSYRDEIIGQGGYVFAMLGIHTNVGYDDISSMHPTSVIADKLFGEFTEKMRELLEARISIKHGDFESAKNMFDGRLQPYLTDKSTSKDLAQALKIALNSVYGLTAAKFDNPFKDPRNTDNIVAKRGELFMINLKHELQDKGYQVVHIKTDSIKVADATEESFNIIKEYGKLYGYTFEHVVTYDRMCLVDKAQYIARKTDGTWEAVGAKFAVPYVFKTLFSKEDIIFDDLCETKSSTYQMYLDMNEDLPDVTDIEKSLTKYVKETGKKEKELLAENDEYYLELKKEIDKGHNYIFIGKVSKFCPIKKGCGGGLLVWKKDEKYNNVAGTTGYRWLESEMVQTLEMQDNIDIEYYNNLANDAIQTISKYGDYEWFVSDESSEEVLEELPFV